jgi:SAM-dependent methyltransferase
LIRVAIAELRRLATIAQDKLVDRIARHVGERTLESNGFFKRLSYRVALETLLAASVVDKKPNEVFSSFTDDFWFLLCTEGIQRNQAVRALLPGMPNEDVQLMYTGSKGRSVMEAGFNAYRVFRDTYEQHVGPIAHADAILDFGCGWGRIIRFFLKDVEPSVLRGVDPVEAMIEICRRQNRWCNFETIPTKPPTPFKNDTFDLIYSFSVFSHLSEEMHKNWLAELSRILKPGGLLLATTHGRDFIEHCARLRKRKDLQAMHEGPRSSARAFLNTEESLALYDAGAYCFTQLITEGEWSYWGEAAISKDYVLSSWTQHLTFVDYLDDRQRCSQDVIVMKKAAVRDSSLAKPNI